MPPTRVTDAMLAAALSAHLGLHRPQPLGTFSPSLCRPMRAALHAALAAAHAEEAVAEGRDR